MLIKNEASEEIDDDNDINCCNDNLNEVLNNFVLICDKSLIIEITEEEVSDVSNVSFLFLITVIWEINSWTSSSNDAFKEFV